MGEMTVILVLSELAEIRPIVSYGAFVSQIFSKVSHLFLDSLRHSLNALEGFPLDDDLIHRMNVIKK